MQIPPLTSREDAEASARRWTYRGVIAVLVVGALGIVAWQWRSGVTITSVEVRDSCETSWFDASPGCHAIQADRDRILEAAAVEPGELLYQIDAADIVDRVSAHPWVASADVRRTPGGKLIVDLTPREAALLVVRSGRPSYFVDAEGYGMPFVPGVAFDVPLVHGVKTDFKGKGKISDDRVRRIAALMIDLEPEIDALISEIELKANGRTVIHTTPVDRGESSVPSIEVLVNVDGLDDQLVVLRAYWEQTLLPSHSPDVRQIDLRFNSRIITR